MNKLILLSIVIIGLGIGIYIFNYILFPSYVSVVAACYPDKFDRDFSQQFAIAGKTTFNQETNSTPEVSYSCSTPDIKTIKHEYCHVIQALNGRFSSCNSPLIYFNEIECYISEILPNNIYEKIYEN